MNARITPGRWKRLLPALALVFLVPASAHAHGAMTAGELNAIFRPLLIPAHLLVLASLVLWIAQNEAKHVNPFLIVFAPLTAIAIALTLTGFITEVGQPILICIALATATLVVLEKTLPPIAAGTLFGFAALAIGFDSGVEGAVTKEVIRALFGIWMSLVLVVFSLSHYVSLCTKKAWAKVGVRVLGSWIIAISLLMLAFSLKK
jgi:urease accessory protein